MERVLICIIVAIATFVLMVTWWFSKYVHEHNGLRHWKEYYLKAMLDKPDGSRIELTCNKNRILAKNCKLTYQKDVMDNVLYVKIEGEFDQNDILDFIDMGDGIL